MPPKVAFIQMVGQTISHYRITEKLGGGGMGVVYRAEDTKLGRAVAIKFLPEQLAKDHQAIERFEREARTIASLNHPNICTLYDVVHQDGTDYLVMELLEGETLAERLEKGPLPLDQVLTYAIQIADALDKAHRKGITHRDLKPGNIMLTKAGAKLLDFGLAKLRQEEAAPPTPLSQLPTVDGTITAQGTIVGTLHYMAPEQLEGKAADARTDIFAFGAVVYEMATGKKAFEGKSQASIIAKILEGDPQPMTSLQPMTPPALDRAVKKCLAKDPDERWQSAADLGTELKWISEPASQTTSSSGFLRETKARADWRQIALWSAITAVAAAAIAVAATWNLKPSPVPPRPVTRFTISLPPGQRLAGLERPPLAFSPDGSELAYVATTQDSGPQQIYLRAMDSGTTKPIPGTEGATYPFFSPDGQWLGFFAAGKLKKISVSGGVAQVLSDAPLNLGASWGTQGTIVFSPGLSVLQQVAEGGSAPQAVTRFESGEYGHVQPEFLPGSRAVFFNALGTSTLAVQRMGGRDGPSPIQAQSGNSPSYASSGYLIYGQAGNLVAVPFDSKRLEVRGGAVPVVQGVMQTVTAPFATNYTLSATGSLAYIPAGTQATQAKLVWVSRNGVVQPLVAPASIYDQPRLSPDGRRIAVDITEGSATQVELYDLARDTLSRFTFKGNVNALPTWTPDGKRIAFTSYREGPGQVFWQLADGSGGLERLANGNNDIPFSWSPDGNFLALVEFPSAKGDEISVLSVGSRQAEPFLQTGLYLDAPQFSPDGHWLAYVSLESGRPEIYVQPYPGPGGKWQISNDGGTEPQWNRNGRELFYRLGDKVMAADISTQSGFAAGKPRQLFEGHFMMSSAMRPNYDVSRDGQRFLMLKPVEQEQAAPTQINVVLNWTEELKRLVPTGK